MIATPHRLSLLEALDEVAQQQTLHEGTMVEALAI